MEIKDLKDVEAELVKQNEVLTGFIEKASQDVKDTGEIAAETKSALENVSTKCTELAERCADIEQKLAEQWNPGGGGAAPLDIGAEFTKSDQWADMVEGRQRSARVEYKTAIVNATGQNQPLVPADRRPGIIAEPERVLRMRDVIAGGRTTSNLVEYAKENVFTNNAGPQVGNSPEEFENVTKPESGITFTLATAAVTTLAHWIPASKQVLADSPMLETYINTRMMYGLKLKEDTQILLGTGANGELDGLYTNRTAYSSTSPITYSTKLDVLRDAMTQTQTSEYMPTAIILNPTDWGDIELSKDSQGRYLFANPQTAAAPRLWGLPVVISNSMAAGTFLVGAFDMAAQLWDREDASIEVSRENSDNFVKNMVTILAEERLAITIYRPLGLVGGSFTVT